MRVKSWMFWAIGGAALVVALVFFILWSGSCNTSRETYLACGPSTAAISAGPLTTTVSSPSVPAPTTSDVSHAGPGAAPQPNDCNAAQIGLVEYRVQLTQDCSPRQGLGVATIVLSLITFTLVGWRIPSVRKVLRRITELPTPWGPAKLKPEELQSALASEQSAYEKATEQTQNP